MSTLRQRIQQRSLWLLESRVFWAILLAGVFVANAIWCSRNRLAGDVSWYLYAVSRLQAGAVLYRDIHDMNPPIVYLMYLPLGWLNYATGWRIDWLLYAALAFTTALLTVWTWFIPKVSFATRGIFALSIAVAALSLNRFQLGQRDPICALLFTGFVISAFQRLQKHDPGPVSWLAVAAASFGMAMKPHFLAPWALVVALMAWRLGVIQIARWKEVWLPLAVSITAWSVTFLAFPDFRTMIALAYRYYSNINVSVYEFAPLLIPVIVAAYALGTRKSDMIQVSALATLGFAASCILQRKGFPYHLAPSMYWAAITAGLMLAESLPRHPALTVTAAAVLPLYSLWSATLPPPAFFAPTAVEAFVSAEARGKTVLTLSTDLRTGFPLILEAGAINARADAQLWMLGEMYRDQVQRADASVEPVTAKYHTESEMDASERERFDEIVRMVVGRRPAIILVQTTRRKWGLNDLQFDFIDYLSTDERFRQALKSYQPGPANDKCRVLVLAPSTLAQAGAAR